MSFTSAEFLDPFLRSVPQEHDGELECNTQVLTCAFNRHGTLFAVGCSNGNILVWDFLTRSLAKKIPGFDSSIVSLSWSHNGKLLVCSSSTCYIFVFNVLEGTCEKRFKLPSSSLKVQFHPEINDTFLACPTRHSAVLINITGSFRIVPRIDDNESGIIGAFDNKGAHLYVGNSAGKVAVFSYTDFSLKASFKISSTAQSLKSIDFSKHGGCFIVNAADRIIRVYSSEEVLICGVNGEPEPMQRLQDMVNRAAWTRCCFSGDGEYICAGSSIQNELYIWGRHMGNLVKVLRGSNGHVLQDIEWHPSRPVVISLSNNSISLWTQNQVEKWSAFVPGFTELEENIEYEERESEFDSSDEDRSVILENKEDDEILEVDVVNVDPGITSNNESESLLYLPAYPTLDEGLDEEKEIYSVKSKSQCEKVTHPKKKSKFSK